jgi:hypothetical protein
LRDGAAGQPRRTVFRLLARAFLIRRLLGGRRGARSRGGFFGPMPYYSTRTRRGSRVSVSGCCLPIPLLLTVGAGAGLRLLVRR